MSAPANESEVFSAEDIQHPDAPQAVEVSEDVSVPVDSTPQEPAKPFPTEKSDEDPIEADPEKDDIERLLSNPNGPFELSTGTRITIHSMKMREFLRLLRIITRGASMSMGGLNLNFDQPDEFVQQFLGLIIFSIPEAEEETIEFVKSMVSPADPTGNKEVDIAAHAALLDELDNPELEDLVNIIGAVVASEGADLTALGKRLRSMFGMARKMGVLGKPTAKGQPEAS